MSEILLPPQFGQELAHRLGQPNLVIDVFMEDHTVPTPPPNPLPVPETPSCCVHFVPAAHLISEGAAVPARYAYDQPYPFAACAHPQRTSLESGCSPCVYPYEAMTDCSYAQREPWTTVHAARHDATGEQRAVQVRRNTRAVREYRMITWHGELTDTPDALQVLAHLAPTDYTPEMLEQAVKDMVEDLTRPDHWVAIASPTNSYFGAFV